MKLVFIAGLEHSGSTLTDFLLSQREGVLGLGEVASFFSPEHMRRYMGKYGENPDADLCSCGENWDGCEFWGDLMHCSGLNSNAPFVEKYRSLISHVKSRFGYQTVVIDSSKSLFSLREIVENLDYLGISEKDIIVVVAIKDVRSFAASIARKNDGRSSIVSRIRTFNWWLGENRKLLDFLQANDIPFLVNLYEDFCREPSVFIDSVFHALGHNSAAMSDKPPGSSHIAMGNRDFFMRNRERIRYDTAWFNDDAVNLVYLLHKKARTFNRKLYAQK